jgi:hypothetical protein
MAIVGLDGGVLAHEQSVVIAHWVVTVARAV